MIGGPDEAVAAARPDLRHDRARASTRPSARPGRDGDPSTAENGYLHCGPSGAGPLREDGPQRDRVRGDGRLRRGPQHPQERRRRQARSARPTPRPRRSTDPEYYQYELDIPEVAEVWRRGSVIGSWLLDLTAAALRRVADLDGLRGPRLGLRRGPLDLDRGDRGGRAGAGAHHGALLALRLPRPRRLRRQGALGDAQAVRRPRREEETGLRRDGGGPRRRRGGGAPRRRADRARRRAGDRRPGARSRSRSAAATRRGGCSSCSASTSSTGTRIEVFQVDERIAPDGDPDRNLTHLLASLPTAGAARVRPMPVDDDDLEAAAAALRRAAARRARPRPPRPRPRRPHRLAGPGDPVLEVADRRVALTGEYQGRRRMTLTYPALEAAREVLWLVTGADKREALAKLRAGDPSIPAGRVRAREATADRRAPTAEADLDASGRSTSSPRATITSATSAGREEAVVDDARASPRAAPRAGSGRRPRRSSRRSRRRRATAARPRGSPRRRARAASRRARSGAARAGSARRARRPASTSRR